MPDQKRRKLICRIIFVRGNEVKINRLLINLHISIRWLIKKLRMMGKKRAISVRRIAEKLLEKYPDMFTDNFEENKGLVSKVLDLPTKTIRNEVAGYIQRLKKRALIMPLPIVPTAPVRPNFSRRRRGRRSR
jgi:small subunit ribosomal protein S17e